MGLAKELHFIYRLLEPSKLTNLQANKFVVLHRGGSIGVGEFAEIPWHKQEKEHILKVFGIKVEYGEEIDYGKSLGDFNTVSDHEHIMLVEDYVQGYSQKNIATIRRRSSATVNAQIRNHNYRVAKLGYFARCKRTGSKYFNVSIARGRIITG